MRSIVARGPPDVNGRRHKFRSSDSTSEASSAWLARRWRRRELGGEERLESVSDGGRKESAMWKPPVIGVAFLMLGCGSDTPPSPSPSPTPAQIAGAWRGTGQTTTSSGGECFAPLFQGLVGVSSTFTLTVN